MKDHSHQHGPAGKWSQSSGWFQATLPFLSHDCGKCIINNPHPFNRLKDQHVLIIRPWFELNHLHKHSTGDTICVLCIEGGHGQSFFLWGEGEGEGVIFLSVCLNAAATWLYGLFSAVERQTVYPDKSGRGCDGSTAAVKTLKKKWKNSINLCGVGVNESSKNLVKFLYWIVYNTRLYL